MRIVLLVLIAYALFYSFYAFIQSVRKKEVCKLQLFKNNNSEDESPAEKVEPNQYRRHILLHFISILVLSVIITALALL